MLHDGDATLVVDLGGWVKIVTPLVRKSRTFADYVFNEVKFEKLSPSFHGHTVSEVA